ncbi:karyopherin [Savitreella phatthalungensis]
MSDDEGLALVVRALEVIHDPTASNDSRQSAQRHLDQLSKDKRQACVYGNELANQSSPIVRHYGLNLLGTCLTRDWASLSPDEKIQVRKWVVALCLGISDNEANFIVEKLAALLVDLAKREWLLSWSDFDATLLQLWSGGRVRRQLSLKALNNIVEDVFHNDDPLASVRGPILSAGIITIIASDKSVREFYAQNPTSLVHGIPANPGAEGWLKRICDELAAGDGSDALAIFHVLRSTVGFIITRAIVESDVMQRVGQALVSDDIALATCAVDCLYILLTRPLHPKDELLGPIHTLFEPAALQAISHVWQKSASQLHFDEYGTLSDDELYTMLKKLSETVIALACFKFGSSEGKSIPEIDLAPLLDLVMLTWEHASLVISGMSNSFWCSLLRDEKMSEHPHVLERLPKLLSEASSRFLRFEDAKQEMLRGSDVQRYLDVDIESAQEVHAFCGNYRRFVFDIVRMIVYKRPIDAIEWIRANVRDFFAREYQPPSGFCSKTSATYLPVEAKFMLVEAGLRGILRFRDLVLGKANNAETAEVATLKQLSASAVSWCAEIADMTFEDPLTLSKHVSAMVAFAFFLDEHSDLLFRILEKVIQTATYYYPDDLAEATFVTIRDLRGRCGTELLRLAATLPDQLWNVYPQLEATVDRILERPTASEGEHTIFNALLLIVSQRSAHADSDRKRLEFNKLVGKVCRVWNDEGLTRSFSTFDGFKETLQIDTAAAYLSARGVMTPAGLDSCPLDDQGKELVKNLRLSRRWFWPVRASRKFVDASLDCAPAVRELQRTLWREPVRVLVPNILRLLSRIAEYHDERLWASSPENVRLVVSQSVVERFWLHGVSSVTRDEFLEASSRGTNNVREVVHSTGHFLRKTREYCLVSLGTFSMLGEAFYSIEGLSDALFAALYGNTHGMSLHIWSSTVTSCLRHYVLNCPRECWDTVLPILEPFVNTASEKLRAEWAQLTDKPPQPSGAEDSLSDEMMEESLLRHLSYAVVKLISDVLISPVATQRSGNLPNMADWVFRSRSLTAAILSLLTMLLGAHDTRTAIQAAKILKTIVQDVLQHPELELQTFIAHEVYSATIRSIHDPYFVSIQSDLVSLLSFIHWLMLEKSTLPRDILLSIPQMSGAVGAVRIFEAKLDESKTERARRGLMYELLSAHDIVGREAYGRGPAAAKVKLGADVSTKEIIRKFQQTVSIQRDTDVMQGEGDAGMDRLFGNGD